MAGGVALRPMAGDRVAKLDVRPDVPAGSSRLPRSASSTVSRPSRCTRITVHVSRFATPRSWLLRRVTMRSAALRRTRDRAQLVVIAHETGLIIPGQRAE